MMHSRQVPEKPQTINTHGESRRCACSRAPRLLNNSSRELDREVQGMAAAVATYSDAMSKKQKLDLVSISNLISAGIVAEPVHCRPARAQGGMVV